MNQRRAASPIAPSSYGCVSATAVLSTSLDPDRGRAPTTRRTLIPTVRQMVGPPRRRPAEVSVRIDESAVPEFPPSPFLKVLLHGFSSLWSTPSRVPEPGRSWCSAQALRCLETLPRRPRMGSTPRRRPRSSCAHRAGLHTPSANVTGSSQ